MPEVRRKPGNKKGFRHSALTKIKIRNRMIGRKITWGWKISKALTGRKLSPEHVEKLRNRELGKGEKSARWIPREKRNCICGCGIAFECLLNSKQKYIHGHNNPHLKWYEYNGRSFRSSWEVKYAEYLDNKNIKWAYESKLFPITYQYEGENKNGTYMPDFYIPEENRFIEIKGYWRGDAKVKYEAFMSQYNYNLSLLEEKDLRELGVI